MSKDASRSVCQQKSATQKTNIGAIYARYSSRFQHSIEDQVRVCREWAEKQGIVVPEELVFVDRAISGRNSRRDGLKKIREALQSNRMRVVIIFSTNRLFRKTYQSLGFVEEEIVDRDNRCVFVHSGIDTDDTDRWRQLLQMHAMMDEFVIHSTAEHVRAAQEGLFLQSRICGTITYGYTGETIPGEKTRLGKSARRLVVDPETAAWVRTIYKWFVDDQLTIQEIARRLNAQEASLPSKSTSRRWTRNAVRRLLANSRYRGCWEYGRKKSVWMNKKSYSRQFERVKPLASRQIEALRIIVDPQWYAAQQRLGKIAGNGGRKPRDGDRQKRPRVLNGLLFCAAHNRALYVHGSYGQYMSCPVCREEAEPALFSQLPRRLALQMICQRLAESILTHEHLLPSLVEKCQHYVRSAGQPDHQALEKIQREEERLTRQITFILEAPGDSDQDQAENRRRLAQLREERVALQCRKAEIEQAVQNPVAVPSTAEVHALLQKLAQILQKAAISQEPAELAAVRTIIVGLTGGRILLTQQGERKRKKGWLRATLTVHWPQILLRQLGFTQEEAGEGEVIEIDILPPDPKAAIRIRVKELYNQGWMQKDIAREVDLHRSQITKLLKEWEQLNHEKLPDGRRRRHYLSQGKMASPRYQKIAEEAKQLWDEDIPTKEIARQLNCSPPTVERSVQYWHEIRGLPIPREKERKDRLFQQAKRLFDNGWQIKQIANRFHYTPRGMKLMLESGFANLGLEFPDGRSRRGRSKKAS